MKKIQLLIILFSILLPSAAQDKNSDKSFYPAFSWERVPVYKMFGSDHRLLEDHERRFIASGSNFICIEKQHGRDLLGGAELGTAYEIERFRQLNPDMKILFYFNSAYAYPFTTYTKGFQFGNIDEALRPFILIDHETGELADRTGVYCFDVLNPDFRQWWVETVAQAVAETGADGLFVDQMHAFTFRRPAADRQSAIDAQALMMQMTKEALGEDKILLLNNAAHISGLNQTGDAFMFEHYNTNLLSKENIYNDWQLMKQLSDADKISVWRIGVEYEAEGTELEGATRQERLYGRAHEFEALAREHLDFYLAAFLIGARENSYFQYGWGWGTTTGPLVDYPEFRTPLGAPKADYVQESAWVFTREFEHARVRVDLEKREGIIDWDFEPMDEALPPAGPSAIKDELVLSGAFEVPGVYFTNEYDALKTHPHLQGLFFDALPYEGNPTKVFCWYGIPEGTQPGDKLPAVVLLHGGGGNVFPDWVKKWNDQGYIAISLALEGQLPGTRNTSLPPPHYPVHEFSGPYREGFFNDAENKSLQDQWFYHAVANAILANSLLHSFPNVDTTKIGLTGISWGGILTNVVAGLDDRFAFSIPVYGCGYLHETPNYSNLIQRLNNETQYFYLRNWEPSLFVPYQTAPTLFVNGTNDCHFSMNSFTKTYKASPNEKYLRVEHNMPHGHAPGWNPNSIYAFADYILKDGSQPFHVTSYELKENGEITFHYEGDDITTAQIYITTDPGDWSCENYEWTEIQAAVDPAERTIKGTLPWGTRWFFVNGTNADGVMFSSPMQKPDFPIEPADDEVLQRDPLLASDSLFFTFIPDVHVPELPANSGSTSFTTTYTPSGSTWHEQLVEEDVFLARMTHHQGDSLHWDLRVGKGGQIYSLIGPYGENVPPQYRSWDFNTSRWVDDVWQPVNVASILNNNDEIPAPPGTTLGRPSVRGMSHFIHGAGVYMNDPLFLDPGLKPFYSPMLASYYDPSARSYSLVNWGQQAHTPSLHKSGMLHTTRYKDLGSGVLETTYLFTNFGKDVFDRHNTPWGGVRASSLPQTWISRPDHSLERSFHTFGGDDSGIVNSIDETGGYFIWAAEGEEGSRPAFGIVFGKDRHMGQWEGMASTILRWGQAGTVELRNYHVFTVITRLPVRPGQTFFYRVYYISGTMDEVHERAQKLVQKTDYGFIDANPLETPLTKIKTSDFDNALTEDIKLFTSPIKNMVPLFLLENIETGLQYISPDLYHNVTTAPFTNPYPPDDPKYETYQDRIVYKPYDGKIKYIRLLGYAATKEQVSTNIRFALLDTLVSDTSKVVITEEWKNRIWIPLEPCFNCAWDPSGTEQGLILYNDFDNNQYIPWSNPTNLTFTDKEDNPAPSDGNPSLKTGKVVRGNGIHANVRFQLPDYLDLSYFNTFSVKVYYEGAEQLPPVCNIRLILRNNGLGATQYALTQNIKSANAWDDYVFDVSGAVGRDTYNQAWLFFSSPDNEGTTAGHTFYVDDLMGPPLTINPNLLNISTSMEGDQIIIRFPESIYALKNVSNPVFMLSRDNDEPIHITGVHFDTAHIYLNITEELTGRDVLKLSFTQGNVEDESGRILPFFFDQPVLNTIPLTSLMLTFAISDGMSPLPGATVELDGIQNISGTGGTVTFPEVEPGKINSYTISKSGYDSISGTIAITSDTVINIVMSLSIYVPESGSGKISFFPNPANDRLFLSSADEMEKVIIMDLFGKVLVYSRIGADSFSIGTENLSPGLYLVRVQMQNGEWLMGRFVIGR